MKHELDKIKLKYLKKGTMYGYYNYNIAQKILNVMKNSKSYEKPDFYYLDKNTCFVFEHFEFDASHSSKRQGSSFMRKEKQVEREIKNKHNEKLKSVVLKYNAVVNCGVECSKIDCKFNKEDWKQNFLSSFNRHYNRIETYKENLMNNNIINETTKIKNVFVIEDTTEFGAIESFKTGGILYPFNFDFGVDVLIKSKKINYFVFLSKAKEQIYIVNRSALKKIKSVQLNFLDTKINFFSNVNVVSACITIPNKFIE